VSKIALWTGQDIREHSLLVWTDQGLGDTIQMARWLPMIDAKMIYLYVEAPAFNLMRYNFASEKLEVRMKGWAFPRTDYHVPMTSLMAVFHAEPGKIPLGRYLKAPEWTSPWSDPHRYDANPLRIGINWKGNAAFSRDGTRSMPLEMMRPLFDCGSIVSLQKGNAQQDINGHPVVDLMDACHDLLDTASLIDSLDVVVTTDTVIPHLAGALGKRTYLLEQWETEWRWGFGETSPWYDTVHVLRQEVRNDWPSAVAKVRERLRVAS
jgi:hypothetical protein